MPSAGVATPQALANGFQIEPTDSWRYLVNWADVPDPSDLTTTRMGRFGSCALPSCRKRLSDHVEILPVKINAMFAADSFRSRICSPLAVFRLYITEVPPATMGRYEKVRFGYASSFWYGISETPKSIVPPANRARPCVEPTPW